VARYGDGWSPFPAPRTLASTAKTRPLETVDDLRPMLDELWQFMEEAGREPASIDVAFGTGAGGRPGDDSFKTEAHLAAAEELTALGVTWSGAGVPGDSLAHALEALERFGSSVIR
jgi:hypothetical protein